MHKSGGDCPDATVYVVDDDPDVREAIELLARSASLKVQSYPSADSFLDACKADISGCLVLEVRMPGLSGLELQDTLAARGITIPIVFVTGYGDVAMAARAMRNGAVDFIEKPFHDGQLLRAIRHAVELNVESLRQRQRQKALAERTAQLTAREREVMELLIAGKHTKQIAAELGISIKTVDKHRAKILQKMGVESVVELTRLVFRSATAAPSPKPP